MNQKAKPEALESHESLRAPTVVESSMAHSRARSTLFGDSSVRVDLRGFRSEESPPPVAGAQSVVEAASFAISCPARGDARSPSSFIREETKRETGAEAPASGGERAARPPL